MRRDKLSENSRERHQGHTVGHRVQQLLEGRSHQTAFGSDAESIDHSCSRATEERHNIADFAGLNEMIDQRGGTVFGYEATLGVF